MAGINVTVKPEIINWILRTIQFENVANSVTDLLYKWQSGEKKPTFNQVELISKKTNIPFGYFFLDKPPVEDCPIVEYRTVENLSVQEPSRNLMETLDLMTDIQDWMVNYVIDNGQEALTYVGSKSSSQDIEATVAEIRNYLNLEKEWYKKSSSSADSFRYIRHQLENIGILFMMSGIVGNNTKRKLDVEEFRAFTLVNTYVPLIFINTCDSDAGKLFSALHELTHIWIGVNSFYNEKVCAGDSENDIEKFCNAVAAELLVPTEFFLMYWGKENEIDLDNIENLAKYFKCSRYVIARKALDLNKISKKRYSEIIVILTDQYKKWLEKQVRNSGGNFYKTLGSRIDHRLVVALANSTREGKTSYTEAYRLTNTNQKTFEKLLNDIGGA